MSEKKFKLTKEQIRPLISEIGAAIASDHITVEGRKVGYMYREKPTDPHSSGWCFFSGAESPAYTNDSNNFAIYDANTIANYDPAIIPYVNMAAPCAFARIKGTDRFQQEGFTPNRD